MARFSWRFSAILLGTLVALASITFRPSLAQAPPAATVALTGARVIDGTGRAPIEQATLVIENGRIAAVGRISPDYIVQDGVIPRTALPEVLRRLPLPRAKRACPPTPASSRCRPPSPPLPPSRSSRPACSFGAERAALQARGTTSEPSSNFEVPAPAKV